MSFEKPKKKKTKKIKITEVQKLFNKAIVERDRRCIECGKTENLQSSHFYAVGGSNHLRFHPDNANCHCAGCHIKHHNRDPLFYAKWYMQHQEKLKELEGISHNIKYSQVFLSKLKELIKIRDFDGIKELLERGTI